MHDYQPTSVRKETQHKEVKKYSIGNVDVEIYPEEEFAQVTISSETDNLHFLFTTKLPVEGLASVFRTVIAELNEINQDPKNTRNIDPLAKENRSINLFSDFFSKQVGEAVVVKKLPLKKDASVGEDLIKQFLFMNQLRKQWLKNATPAQQSAIEINQVFGCADGDDAQYLFMEAVEDAIQCQDTVIRKVSTDGIARPANVENGVDLTHYPEFLTLFPETEQQTLAGTIISWRRVSEQLQRITGLRPNDVNGRNFLVSVDKKTGKRKLCLIDQLPKSTLSVR